MKLFCLACFIAAFAIAASCAKQPIVVSDPPMIDGIPECEAR